MIKSHNFKFSPEVEAALNANDPIVALESTVIAHGLPRPQNLETAHAPRTDRSRSRRHSRDHRHHSTGNSPSDSATNRFGSSPKVTKSRKSVFAILPIAVAQKWNGATTVASTSWIAQRAGIKVFATGGIGGVHRGSLPDVSGDLPALATTSIVVVCSGAKIVLDLPATREWLETYGITVVGYRCDEMPAFYSRDSGLPVDVRVDSPDEVAEIFRAQQALGIERALLGNCSRAGRSLKFRLQLWKPRSTRRWPKQKPSELPDANSRHFCFRAWPRQSEGATLRANIASAGKQCSRWRLKSAASM